LTAKDNRQDAKNAKKTDELFSSFPDLGALGVLAVLFAFPLLRPVAVRI
jgi:hypothetical protein